jgi:hypothetical protein
MKDDPDMYLRRQLEELRSAPDQLKRVADEHEKLVEEAVKSLAPAMISKGASAFDATKAAYAISLNIVLYRVEQPEDARRLAAVRSALDELDRAVSSLTPRASSALQLHLNPSKLFKIQHSAPKTAIPSLEFPGPIPGYVSAESPSEIFSKFISELPYILRQLPAPEPRNGGQDARLRLLIRQTALIWAQTTNEWPTLGRKTCDGAAVSTLHRFVREHSKKVFSPETWRSAVNAEKRRTDRYLLGTVSAPKRGRPKKQK